MSKLIFIALLLPVLAQAGECSLLYGFDGHKVYQCENVKKICTAEGCKTIKNLEVFDADEFVFGGRDND